VELSPLEILGGEPSEQALQRWRAFLQPGDILCAWGRHTFDLLAHENGAPGETLDLRGWVGGNLPRRTGGIETAARAFGNEAPLLPWAPGRAGRRLAGLSQLLATLGLAPQGQAAVG
jgi:hypothetical protein